MSRTLSGHARKWMRRRAKQHKQRAQWSGRNGGVRARTLNEEVRR